MTNFTPEDLLMYLYKESSAEQTAAIETALEKDWTLREKLNVLKTSMQRLDKITTSPRKKFSPVTTGLFCVPPLTIDHSLFTIILQHDP